MYGIFLEVWRGSRWGPKAGTTAGVAARIRRNYGRHFVAGREIARAVKLTAFEMSDQRWQQISERLRTTGASDARGLEARAKLLDLEAK